MILLQIRSEWTGATDAAPLFQTGGPRVGIHEIIILVSVVSSPAPNPPRHYRKSTKEDCTSNTDDNTNDDPPLRWLEARTTT